MGKIGKTFALLLTLTIIMSCVTLLTVKPVNAQTIPKPFTPEFAVNLEDNNTLMLTINNQPFTPYLINSTEINLFYQVRFKLHSQGEEAWNVQYGAWNQQSYPQQSASEYTILPLNINSISSQGYSNDNKWDIQVQAMVGNISLVESSFIGGVTYWDFDGKKSDWSSIHTISVPTSFASPTIPEATTSSSTPNMPRNAPHLDPIIYLIPVSVIVAIVIVLSILLFRRHRKTANLGK